MGIRELCADADKRQRILLVDTHIFHALFARALRIRLSGCVNADDDDDDVCERRRRVVITLIGDVIGRYHMHTRLAHICCVYLYANDSTMIRAISLGKCFVR